MRDTLEVLAVALAFGALVYFAALDGIDRTFSADCDTYCSADQPTDFCEQVCR